MDEVDLFSQSLQSISVNVLQLAKKILDVYNKGDFDTAKNLIQDAPNSLFDIHRVKHGGHFDETILLIDLINRYSYAQENAEQKALVIEFAIEKSKPEQLLNYTSDFKTALNFAMGRGCPDTIIKKLLEKAPGLLEIDLFHNEKKENNPLLRVMDNLYYQQTDPEKYFAYADQAFTNIEVLIGFMNTIKFKNNQQKLRYYSSIITEILSKFNAYVAMLISYKKVEQEAEDILDDLFKKTPIMIENVLKNCPEDIDYQLPLLLNRYVDMNENLKKKYVPIIKAMIHPLQESKKDIGDVLFEFEDVGAVLKKQGFIEGKQYALKDILKKIGLENIL